MHNAFGLYCTLRSLNAVQSEFRQLGKLHKRPTRKINFQCHWCHWLFGNSFRLCQLHIGQVDLWLHLKLNGIH